MGNFGLKKLMIADETNFTSNVGMKIRKYMYKPLQKPLRLATPQEIVIDGEFPKLEKEVPYIFASSHSFCEDINAALAIMDRNAYLLLGSTDQFENNKGSYAVWANGVIYVNRLDSQSCANSIKKMERLINSGTSVLIFPEGGYNNTENLLCEKIFSGVYWLSRNTGAKVVPIASFCESGSDKIYIKLDTPLNLYNKSKDEAKEELRNYLGIMTWELIRDYSTPLVRKELPSDCRIQFMEERKKEYLKNKWTRDVWDEEIHNYVDMLHPTPQQVRASLENVNITCENAAIFAPILARIEEDKKHDFKTYMKKTWNK